MSGSSVSRRGLAGLVVPALFTVACLAVLVSLGLWQLERLAWKQGVIATLSERLTQPPSALPPASEWAALKATDAEFRRVRFAAEFLNDREALIHTAGSPLRPDVSGRGYWVMTPARLADGSVVMVNRGFVPEGRQDPATRREGEVAGVTELVGVLRWPETRGMFTPADEPGRNLWFIRDQAAIAAAKGVGPVGPFYIDLEGPRPPGGLPRAGALRVSLPNNHLQYAVTWFGLALTLLAVFLVWVVRRPR